MKKGSLYYNPIENQLIEITRSYSFTFLSAEIKCVDYIHGVGEITYGGQTYEFPKTGMLMSHDKLRKEYRKVGEI